MKRENGYKNIKGMAYKRADYFLKKCIGFERKFLI